MHLTNKLEFIRRFRRFPQIFFCLSENTVPLFVNYIIPASLETVMPPFGIM
jgi:hypothetical protein